MRYLSVCSGIEAASVAWEPLGWEPVAFAEIATFPSAVLAHRYPLVPNLGDFTKVSDEQLSNLGPVQLLIGGTPCQSFSIAGLRQGLRDPRGNLALGFLALAFSLRPKWVIWENVPGVLSSDGGRDFGAFLAGLGQCGYGWSYRVLDAQYFGVAQRRRRVFVVGCLGGQPSTAEVLFEPNSMLRHTPPSRETGQRVAGTVAASAPSRRNGGSSPTPSHLIAYGGGRTSGPLEAAASLMAHGNRLNVSEETFIVGGWPAETACALQACFGDKQGLEDQHINAGAPLFVPSVSHTLRAEGYDGSEDGSGRGTPLVPVAFDWQSGGDVRLNVSDAHTSALQANQTPAIRSCMGVRRITPTEAERLQGFPDGWTAVPYRGKPAEQCPDGPRYHAIGNSMAVPVVRWIGRRIQDVEAEL